MSILDVVTVSWLKVRYAIFCAFIPQPLLNRSVKYFCNAQCGKRADKLQNSPLTIHLIFICLVVGVVLF